MPILSHAMRHSEHEKDTLRFARTHTDDKNGRECSLIIKLDLLLQPLNAALAISKGMKVLIQ